MPYEQGPPDDPYANLPGVEMLDQQLRQLRPSLDRMVVNVSDEGGRSALEKAALQIIPGTSSIGSSIRVLVKEGYLLSALVMLRPLYERSATLTYLAEHPDAVELWSAGWPHGKRPKLSDRVAALMPAPPGGEHLQQAFAASVSKYNSFIHGDPIAGEQSRFQAPGWPAGYSLDRDYGSPQRANTIGMDAGIGVVFLGVAIDRIFPPESQSTSG